MTSYPKRIQNIDKSISSILANKEVDEVVLNLSIDEFPNKKADLPVFLTSGELSKKISINYLYGNTKPFKKLIPTLSLPQYKNCIVFTCDDDCVYPDGIFGNALDMYTGDKPLSFNMVPTYNWGNGRLSIYEYKYFGECLNLFDRPKVWDTNNDDVAYGFLMLLNGYKYTHKDLDAYNKIQFLDEAGDMHNNNMYSPYVDHQFFRKYIADRFGVTYGQLMTGYRIGDIRRVDSDHYKKDNINEIVIDDESK